MKGRVEEVNVSAVRELNDLHRVTDQNNGDRNVESV